MRAWEWSVEWIGTGTLRAVFHISTGKLEPTTGKSAGILVVAGKSGCGYGAGFYCL